MVLKKKEIIAAALVVLIGTAGYLNWSYQDTIHVTDGESYIETGKKLGEAQYVNSVEEVEENSQTAAPENTKADNQETSNNESGAVVETTVDTGGYFEQAKIDKENSRAKSLEILNQTAENVNFDEEIRKKAGEQILNTASNVEKETEIESIAQSKGYSEICAYVDENGVNIMVRKEGFANEDVVKLTDIATAELGISAKDVKIIEVR
ncbi:MAG: SpoIIIAH-like family protein [Clostridia bacterium]|nr:SpoIIIAH-like family protein [Clostridia bacterium]